MPWYRAQFDLEGLGFGGLALVLAILLGGIHWILMLIFFLVFIVVLLASRDTERTSPVGEDLVLSPCDGIIESVSSVLPPRELRWDTQEVVRVRISSSPFSVNGVRAPMTGNVDSYIVEPGAPSALSFDAENSDLREAFILTSNDKHAAGLRVATGGLGPRLDIDLEAGDGVRAGRKIGVRRLGGWTDVYLPGSAIVTMIEGMSVIGGESVLSDLSDLEASFNRTTMFADPPAPPPEPEPVEPVPVVSEEPAASEAPTADAEIPNPEPMPEKVIDEEATTPTPETDTENK